MTKKQILYTIFIVFLTSLFFINTSTAGYNKKVYEAQIKLKKLGYEPGPIDGFWGEKTREAIAKYQKDSDLPVTGQLDNETKEKLAIGKHDELKTNESYDMVSKELSDLSKTLEKAPKATADFINIFKEFFFRFEEQKREEFLQSLGGGKLDGKMLILFTNVEGMEPKITLKDFAITANNRPIKFFNGGFKAGKTAEKSNYFNGTQCRIDNDQKGSFIYINGIWYENISK